MGRVDDELAALLALDALEPDEQADAEMRMGTFPPEVGEVSAALADRVGTVPPPDLRATVLDLARSRRRPGHPIDAPTPCPAAEGFERTLDELHGLLGSLTAEEWNLPAHDEHGRVRDVIAHLIGVERLSARWLDPDEDGPVMLDHVAATGPVVEELASVDPQELAGLWRDAALAVARAAASGDPNRRVAFHDMQADVAGFLITRTFELWAHSMDISLATGRPLLTLDAARMRTLSSRLMGAVPLTLAYRGHPAPRGTVRFVLTGTAGGCYDVPLHSGDRPGEPDATIIADATDLCRVAARRLTPGELDAAVEGDGQLAELVLAGLDAFARD